MSWEIPGARQSARLPGEPGVQASRRCSPSRAQRRGLGLAKPPGAAEPGSSRTGTRGQAEAEPAARGADPVDRPPPNPRPRPELPVRAISAHPALPRGAPGHSAGRTAVVTVAESVNINPALYFRRLETPDRQYPLKLARPL